MAKCFPRTSLPGTLTSGLCIYIFALFLTWNVLLRTSYDARLSPFDREKIHTDLRFYTNPHVNKRTHIEIAMLHNNSYHGNGQVYTDTTMPYNINARGKIQFGGSLLNYSHLDTVVSSWLRQKSRHCNGSFEGYGNKFALLQNVRVDPSKGHGPKGGEEIMDVLGQPESSEYIKFDPGYFQMICREPFTYMFAHKDDHKKKWMNALRISNHSEYKSAKSNPGPVIAITRYEYANLYFVINDFYNAFLMCKIFKLDPAKTTIMFIDGHPRGAFDSSWSSVFGGMIRAGNMNKTVVFKTMVWSIIGYDSPIHTSKFTPYFEEFRYFYLSRLNVDHKKTLDCSNLNIMFLWRRDYVAHPRNKNGKVFRKVKNEDELMNKCKEEFPGHNITGVQMDLLSFRNQVALIARTDILAGMHGAGFAFTMFLPPHAALLELYPTYWSTGNKHFRDMATWRHLQYSQWQNTNKSLEFANYYTHVPSTIVVEKIRTFIKTMCPR